jgi:hypothetical protein
MRKAAKAEGVPPKPRGVGGHVPQWLRDNDPRVKVRRCLMCSANFWSAHAGNRLCVPCTEKAAQFVV